MQTRESWNKEFRVHSFHCNNNALLRVSSIAKFLQEIAWEHAEHSDAGYHALNKKGLMWILYGLKMEFVSFPKWNDQLVVETWGKKYENLFAYRDFEVKVGNNEIPVIKATSSWIIINSDSRRPQRIKDELHKIPEVNRHAIFQKPGNIDKLNEYSHTESRKILYSDIDIYNHVNNTSYIQFCMDHSSELQKNSEHIKSLDIRFVQETRLGEELLIKSAIRKGRYYFLGLNANTQKEAFRSEVEL
jgi:acyl-ACP thioesterase